MANHTPIAAPTERDVYFCGPHSPWQRRTNENTTACYTDTLLWARTFGAPGALPRRRRGRTEHRPREILGFKTPVQTLEELFSDPSKPIAVAFTA
jgi:transposase, IS30 family